MMTIRIVAWIIILITFCYSLETCTIELKIVRTFHNPIVFRFENDSLKTFVYSGKGGIEWGNIKDESRIHLSSSDFKKACSIINKIDITKIKKLKNLYDDGSVWELKSLNSIDSVSVIIPNPTIDISRRNLSEIIKIAKFFIDLSKVDELRKNFY